MPMVSNLRNPALKNRHWEMIESVLQNKIPGREEHKESGWCILYLSYYSVQFSACI